jgi:hypothetical protein
VEARSLRLRDPDHARHDLDRERERELSHQVGAAALGEDVHRAGGARRDDIGLPARELGGSEGLLDEASLAAMLVSIQLRERGSDRRSQRRGPAPRRERRPVEQHL